LGSKNGPQFPQKTLEELIRVNPPIAASKTHRRPKPSGEFPKKHVGVRSLQRKKSPHFSLYGYPGSLEAT